MADTIRLDFTNELKDYNCQGRADIIGVVVDTRPPQPARNHCDASVLMRVADPSTGTLGGLKIQSFHKLLEGLPQVKVGDILVTRNLSVKNSRCTHSQLRICLVDWS
ncbi:hypothetical protein BDF14DRAFT_803781 [Spinellus fusiger]|nr:hypothetical protein BDF14DRAFT_803781 [Spinellus fusiger]